MRRLDPNSSPVPFDIDDSLRARRSRRAVLGEMVRWALAHLWRPVGSGITPAAESDLVIRHLFGRPEGAPFVDRIDRRIDALPGLDGLGLIAGAVARRTDPEGTAAGAIAA